MIAKDFKIIKNTVINEMNQVLDSFKEDDIDKLLTILSATKNNGCKVCGFGAGRMGYGLRAFMMRLNHIICVL